MIQFKFRLTWPLLILLLIAAPLVILLILARTPKKKPAARPDGSPKKASRTSRFVHDERGARHPFHRPLVIDPDGAPDWRGAEDEAPADGEEDVSFEEALKRGYSAERLREIGNREAMEAGRAAYESFDTTQHDQALNRLRDLRRGYVRAD